VDQQLQLGALHITGGMCDFLANFWMHEYACDFPAMCCH